ncbi:uncharacterized protein BT62DRAFT_1007096 [Guyanagaster necrorhizus]|uniref:Uncharacterized protein n=1 Tax=Guyanagaster necrorhizus TaxID=856835 RepID=A0A9P8ARG4_9AGAR|nr:uncharacterized protein BT62DRAFT_1007096 [Guyanagaster necrorhizus MCA 3950]KAG7445368.1 hypothetical protein BT62DRAFT_1007096 [Guyanagaster necrorhizus MCA 3950]
MEVTHGTDKVREYWDHIPNYEHRGIYPIYRVPETIEHILAKCESPERQQICDLTKDLWLRKNDYWPMPSLGMVLSSGSRKSKDLDSKTKGMKQAFHILVPGVDFLIWKLGCECRIEREDNLERCFNRDEIAWRWRSVMNQQDRWMTDKHRFGPKARPRHLGWVVIRTRRREITGQLDPDDRGSSG